MEISNIQIPTTGFLRLPQVLALIPVGKSTWWRGKERRKQAHESIGLEGNQQGEQ